MVYGPHDDQQREGAILRRILAGRAEIPIGPGSHLWTKCHVDDAADAVLRAADNRSADGRAVNVGESGVLPVSVWFQQIINSAGSASELVHVDDKNVPPDLSASKDNPQHLLFSVALAAELLGWTARDPQMRVEQSVRWHLANTTFSPWTAHDEAVDEAALRSAR